LKEAAYLFHARRWRKGEELLWNFDVYFRDIIENAVRVRACNFVDEAEVVAQD
jgi:hypothetical protein